MNRKCIIWDTHLYPFDNRWFVNFKGKAMDYPPYFREKPSGSRHKYEVYNPWAGGKYISEELLYFGTELTVFDQNNKNISRSLIEKEKIRLSGWVAKENLKGNIPSIDALIKNDDWLEKLPSIPNQHKRPHLLLEGLVKRYSDDIGSVITLEDIDSNKRESWSYNNPVKMLIHPNKKENPVPFLSALTYCANSTAFRFLINSLRESGDIKFEDDYVGGNFGVTVSSKGWKRIEETESKTPNKKSNTAFIAMWIDPSMDNLKKSIERAVRNAGYNPLRIDDKKHINKIDDEILSEIEKSRFVVCDLTSKEKQPRGSVYFEAGYAKGKNIPVIYTCNKKLVRDLPFDIRQYKVLFWSEDNMEDFMQELQSHIEDNNIIDR